MPERTRSLSSVKNDIEQGNFDQEKFIKTHLRTQLEVFKRAWLTENGWRNVIHDMDQLNTYNSSSIFHLRIKCKYLCKSIEKVINDHETST